MSEITIMSAHIPLNEIDNPDILAEDIETFNKIVHYACKLETEDKRSGKTKRVTDADGNIVDMRKKENKDLYQIQTQSTYTKVIECYGVNSYFANSAIRTGIAAMNSQIELSKLYIENKEDTLSSVKDKCNKLKDELKHLERLKASLIKRSPVSKTKKFPNLKQPNAKKFITTKNMMFSVFAKNMVILKIKIVTLHGQTITFLNFFISILKSKNLKRI